MSKTLETSNDVYAYLDFETDVIVLGLIALYRARFDSKCPQYGWLSEAQLESLRVGNHRYRIGNYRDTVNGKTEMGLRIRKDINQFDGGTGYLELFVPYSALKNVSCSIRGRVLNRSMEEPTLAL
jgi:hypothetical protein